MASLNQIMVETTLQNLESVVRFSIKVRLAKRKPIQILQKKCFTYSSPYIIALTLESISSLK